MTQCPRAFVCSIQGPHGVGKSSLVNAIKMKIPGVKTFAESAEKLELRKQPEGEKLRPEVFQFNQGLFIHAEIKRWDSFTAEQTIVMDRGPETTEFFTLSYPRYKDVNWSAEDILSSELGALRRCRSDLLIYLIASEDVLTRRVHNDVKQRPTFERWLSFFEPRAREWFATFSNCVFLDTSKLSKCEVLACAAQLIMAASPLPNSRGA